MSNNPNSVPEGEELHTSHDSIHQSSQNSQATGGNSAYENTVELLPKGTHLPPDRTFLPRNAEMNISTENRQDAIGTGLTNAELRQSMGGATSRTVHQGIGLPHDLSQAEARALGDGGGKKSGAGLAQYGAAGLHGTGKPKYNPVTEYVGEFKGEERI